MYMEWTRGADVQARQGISAEEQKTQIARADKKKSRIKKKKSKIRYRERAYPESGMNAHVRPPPTEEDIQPTYSDGAPSEKHRERSPRAGENWGSLERSGNGACWLAGTAAKGRDQL